MSFLGMMPLPLPADSLIVAEIRRLCLGEMKKVSVVAAMRIGRCYWNCDDWIASHGGTVRYGWLVSTYPNHFVEAVHHAVVQGLDGSLFDVTSYPYGDCSEVSFVEDDRILPSRDAPTFIKSHFIILNDSLPAIALRDVTWRQNEINRLIVRIAVEYGSRFEVGKNLSLPDTPFVRALMNEYNATKLVVDNARALIASR